MVDQGGIILATAIVSIVDRRGVSKLKFHFRLSSAGMLLGAGCLVGNT